jgi:hypothetical protein
MTQRPIQRRLHMGCGENLVGRLAVPAAADRRPEPGHAPRQSPSKAGRGGR